MKNLSQDSASILENLVEKIAQPHTNLGAKLGRPKLTPNYEELT